MIQRQILYSYLDSTEDSFIIMYDWYAATTERQRDDSISECGVHVYEKAGSTFPKNMLCPWTLLQDERTQNDFFPLPYSPLYQGP